MPKERGGQAGLILGQAVGLQTSAGGLVVDQEGFPIMHEVFEGNRVDSTTIGAMLDALEKGRARKEKPR